MSNSFYNVSGTPSQGSAGSSAAIRAEFAQIAAGFDKFPTLGGGTAGQLLLVNAGGTAITTTSVLSISGTTVTAGGNLTVNGNTVLGDAGTDTLTIAPNAVTWSNNPTHSGNHTFSGNLTVNGNAVLGDAGADTLTIAPNAVTWSGNPTHSGNHTFSGTVTANTLVGTQLERTSAGALTLSSANAAGTIDFRTAGSSRGTVNAAGNWSIPNPASGVTLALFRNDVGEILTARRAATAFEISLGTTASLPYVNANNGPLGFFFNGTEYGRLHTSGNFWFGQTADTGSKVQILGSGDALDVASSGNPFMRIRSTGTSAASLYIQNSNTGTTATDGFNLQIQVDGTADIIQRENLALRIFTNNTERLTLRSDGRATLGTTTVGIGTNANTILSLANYGSSAAYASITCSGGQEVILGADTGGVILGAYSNHDVAIRSNNLRRVTVHADGRLSGTQLHNVGTVTGTADQFIASGTWTPTLTAVTNVTGTTAFAGNWIRVGNVVHCAVQVGVDPTANSASTQVGISLPIASDFTTVVQCSGVGNGGLSTGLTGSVQADATNNRAQLQFTTGADNSNTTWTVVFQYEVV